MLGHWVDFGVIVGVVLINALIGFIQEWKAERALDAVRAMLSPQAVALRDGQKRTIDAVELAPGDIVWLQSGDRVPADLRLLKLRECQSMRPCSPGNRCRRRRTVWRWPPMRCLEIGRGWPSRQP